MVYLKRERDASSGDHEEKRREEKKSESCEGLCHGTLAKNDKIKKESKHIGPRVWRNSHLRNNEHKKWIILVRLVCEALAF